MKLFDYDGGFMRFITLLSRLTLLNILWLLSSVPLVTAGAAAAAQCYSLNQLLDDDMHVFLNFKKGFMLHWKKSSAVWLSAAVLSAVFFMSFYILTTAAVPGRTALITISSLAFLTMLLVMLWIYPVMIHFSGSLREIIFNAFVFAFMYAPVTLAAGLFFAAVLFLFVRFPAARPLCLLFGPSLAACAGLSLFRKIFEKYKSSKKE